MPYPPRANARLRGDHPVTAPMTKNPAHAARFTSAPVPIPRNPAARDHAWPDRWPLRTQLELAALDTAPGCARAHACAVLHEWRADPDVTDVAVLILSELLTNAVLSTQTHGCPDPVRMWMLGDRGSVLLLIWDATEAAPVRVCATPEDERGRGLALTDALCAQWDFYHPAEPPGGKVVWALLAPEARSSGQLVLSQPSACLP